MTKFTIPKKGYKEKQAAIAIPCGGNHGTPGIAHFLEHKLFEDEETPIFEAFTKLGASVNAYTSFTHTVYYFNTVDNFTECLALLHRMVENPHITDENVEKEKPIIQAEIDMYADNPHWQVYSNLHRALGLCDSILGTSETINAITKKDLLDFYHEHYDEKALICVGDFPKEEPWGSTPPPAGAAVCQRHTFSRGASDLLSPDPIHSHYVQTHMTVSKPLFQLGFKTPAANPAAATILADILAGESSGLYTTLYEKGNIDNQFSTEYIGDTFLFSGTSTAPQAVRDSILRETKHGITKPRFETIKAKHIGRFIRASNSIETLCATQADLYTKGLTIDNMLENFRSARFEDTEALLTRLTEENHALSVVLPKENV